MDDQKRHDDGMAQRRKVLGDAWVDKSIANKNSFNAEFLDLITRASIRKAGGCDEALATALGIGSVISFVSMVMAAQVGESQAVKLHATELLMLLGTAIVLLVEPPARPQPAQAQVDRNATADALAFEQAQLLNNR